jgi:hypothetical protein
MIKPKSAKADLGGRVTHHFVCLERSPVGYAGFAR